MNLLPYLKQALNLCCKNKGLFVLSCFIDAVFFLVLVGIHYFMLINVKGHVMMFMDIMQENLANLAGENVTFVSPAMLKSAELVEVYHVLLKYALIFAFLLLVTWMIFKGLNWFIANRVVRKIQFMDFARKFIIHTLLAFVCAILIFIIMMQLISYATSSYLPLVGETGARVISLFLIWLLAYFTAIAYALEPATCKNITRSGFKHYKVLVPVHLFVFIGFILLSYLAVESIKINFWAPVIVALLITIPFITFGRFYIVVVVNKLLKRGR